MERNVGTVDASLRITLGLLGLAYGIGRMSRRPYRTPWMLMALSAMKVAEGTTRFCPMLYATGVSSRDDQVEPMMRQMMKNRKSSRATHQSAKNTSYEDEMIETMANEIEEALTSSSPRQNASEQSGAAAKRESSMYMRRGRRQGTDYRQSEQTQPNH